MLPPISTRALYAQCVNGVLRDRDLLGLMFPDFEKILRILADVKGSVGVIEFATYSAARRTVDHFTDSHYVRLQWLSLTVKIPNFTVEELFQIKPIIADLSLCAGRVVGSTDLRRKRTRALEDHTVSVAKALTCSGAFREDDFDALVEQLICWRSRDA